MEHNDILEQGLTMHQNTVIKNLEKYDLGPCVDIEDIPTNDTVTIFDIVDRTFKTDGVDDKIYLTITSQNTGETIFYGRNMYLRTAPILLLVSRIIAIDDCGVNGSMNFIINTRDWVEEKTQPIMNKEKEKV